MEFLRQSLRLPHAVTTPYPRLSGFFHRPECNSDLKKKNNHQSSRPTVRMKARQVEDRNRSWTFSLSACRASRYLIFVVFTDSKRTRMAAMWLIYRTNCTKQCSRGSKTVISPLTCRTPQESIFILKTHFIFFTQPIVMSHVIQILPYRVYFVVVSYLPHL